MNVKLEDTDGTGWKSCNTTALGQALTILKRAQAAGDDDIDLTISILEIELELLKRQAALTKPPPHKP